MTRLAEAALKRPILCLGLLLGVTLAFEVALFRLVLRTDGAAIYPAGNPIVESSENDREVFGDPEQVILLLSSPADGPAVASTAGFRDLKRLHSAVSVLPAVRAAGVRSLASLIALPDRYAASFPRGYLVSIPEEPAELIALIERIRAHPLVDGLFLSANGRAAAIYVPLAEGHSRRQLVTELEQLIGKRKNRDLDLRLTGPVVAEVTLGRQILRDLAWLTPVMAALIAVLLWLGLGTVAGVLIPMVEVLAALVWTLGAMALCGVPVTLVTTILPVILMAMAVADEIHLLERLEARLHATGDSEADSEAVTGQRERLRQATLAALGDVARPIILTSLTTGAGFLSFLTASMAPVRHLGIFTALGILFAMVLTFTLIPALIVVLPLSWFERRPGLVARREPHGLLAHERWVARHARLGFTLALLLLALSAPGFFKLSVQDSWVDNFDPDSVLVEAERELDASFWGSYRFDLVLSSAKEGFFERTEGLELVEELTRRAAPGSGVGGLVSYLDLLRILAQADGHEGKVCDLPAGIQHRLVSMMRFLGRRLDLDQLLTGDGATARIRLFVESPDYQESLDLHRYLNRKLRPLVESREVELRMSGDLPVAVEVVRAIVLNQLRSIVWTLLAVGFLLALAFRSVRLGSIVLAPVVAATAVVFGGMGYGGLPLGIATSMFAALTIGVGVDFAIHFTHGYQRHRSGGGGHRAAVLATLATSGKAIRWNAVVLGLGFLVLSLSDLRPNHSLGILLAAAMLACYATTLLLLPALLRRESRRSGRAVNPGQVVR